MKLSAFLSVIQAAKADDSCPDQELGDLCDANCRDTLTSCLGACSNASCQEQCYNSYSTCSFRCPCNIFCPDGCKDCDNEICPEEGCPDQDLADICENTCSEELGTCLGGCSDASCQENCYISYSTCSFRCPCNIFCPNGCEGCENEICDDGLCPDEELKEICELDCYDVLQTCLEECTSAECHETCYNDFVHCDLHCPCNIFCPNGCEGCDEALICGGDGGNGGNGPRRIVHLGDAGGNDLVGAAFFNTDEFGEIYEKLKLQIPASGQSNTALRNAGFAVYKDEVFTFGGNVRDDLKTRIMKLNGCSFTALSNQLVKPYNSYYGSIAIWDGGSWEPEGVYLCFGSWDYRKYCERFNGTSSTRIATAKDYHQHGAMCVYENQLLAIGGITATEKSVEIFNWEWNKTTDLPVAANYSPCVSVDEGVLLFTPASSGSTSRVWLFSELKWTQVGNFVKGAYGFTAAKLDNNTIMMFPGQYGKSAYRTIWDGEKIDLVETQQILTNGELRHDNVMHPIVFEGALDCLETTF